MARTVTAQSLITGVFRTLGILGQGETPTSPMLLDAFTRLNELVDAWGLERLTQRVVTRQEFALVAGQASYTIGPAALTPDWTAPRPDSVATVALLLTDTTPNTELLLGEMTEAAYQTLMQKGLEGTMPSLWRYEPTMPTGTFTFWPVPESSTYSIVIYVPEALAQFATLTTEYLLAPGYTRALRYNLAREISGEYGRELTADIAGKALESLAALKRWNVPMIDLALDPGLTAQHSRSTYNIYTDQG